MASNTWISCLIPANTEHIQKLHYFYVNIKNTGEHGYMESLWREHSYMESFWREHKYMESYSGHEKKWVFKTETDTKPACSHNTVF